MRSCAPTPRGVQLLTNSSSKIYSETKKQPHSSNLHRRRKCFLMIPVRGLRQHTALFSNLLPLIGHNSFHWSEVTLQQQTKTNLNINDSTEQIARHQLQATTGWPQSRRKKIPEFLPRFFRATNLFFHRLLQEKVNVPVMTFIKGHDDPVYPVNSCFTQIFE